MGSQEINYRNINNNSMVSFPQNNSFNTLDCLNSQNMNNKDIEKYDF